MIDDYLTDGLSVMKASNTFVKFLENPKKETLQALRELLKELLEKTDDKIDFIIDLVIDLLEFYHLADNWKSGGKK
ncbi:hypothetical protein [Muninn virus]|nr:hypothetical protein [Muninn virus]